MLSHPFFILIITRTDSYMYKLSPGSIVSSSTGSRWKILKERWECGSKFNEIVLYTPLFN